MTDQLTTELRSDYERALKNIYDLANKNFPASPQVRLNSIRRIAAGELERMNADKERTP